MLVHPKNERAARIMQIRRREIFFVGTTRKDFGNERYTPRFSPMQA